MCDKNTELVKAIEKFPCIYNHHMPEYLKKDIADKAWHEVANLIQMPAAECKEKWKNLRYGLLRSLRLNPDGTAKKKYYLHDEMEFVLPYMKTSKSHEIILQTDIESIETDEDINVCNDNEILDYSSNHETEFIEPPKKRSYEKFMKPQRINTNDSCDDPRRMFLLSLLPEVNNLTEGQMRVFRRKVLSLLDEIVEDQYERLIFQWQKDASSHQSDTIKQEQP